ncbi:MAG: NAD(P)/FAD-dependent oxidoreductase [bacterium]
MDETKITIIGAGIIGLAIAAELSKNFSDIFVIEKNDNFGQETSSRNSEIIHAGIYYPKNSLKFKLCREGSAYLYETCKMASIPCKQIGKIIIATEKAELSPLEKLFKNGKTNGLEELQLLDGNDMKKIEPGTNAIAGIYSPRTGIVDSHALMKYFVTMSKNNGVEIVYQSEVNFLSKETEKFVVGLERDEYLFKSKIVINCAGLFSDKIASFIGLDPDKLGYRIHFCKGDYFCYTKASPVSLLVYPLPDEFCTGLGIHATLDMGSRLRFGPDDEYVPEIDYKVDHNKADKFYKAAQKIIPNLEKDSIVADMSGIRPKIQGPNESFRDFIIKNESESDLNGFINLIGIESPGLTSCIAIARMVSDMVTNILN